MLPFRSFLIESRRLCPKTFACAVKSVHVGPRPGLPKVERNPLTLPGAPAHAWAMDERGCFVFGIPLMAAAVALVVALVLALL